MKRRVALFALAGLLLSASVVLAAGGAANGYEMRKWVFGGGGGRSEAGGFALHGTIGQTVVGLSDNTPYGLCSGFWCEISRYRVFLPLVLRGS